MMSANNDIKEFRNALITIKGNAMRHGNSVYSIKNIVSMTFEFMRKEIPEPSSIKEKYEWSKFFFKYFIYSLVFLLILLILDVSIGMDIGKIIEWVSNNFHIRDEDIRIYFGFFGLSIKFSFFISVFIFILAEFSRWNHTKYNDIHGLRVTFVNNSTLYFLASSHTGFIEETLKGLEEFISDSGFRDSNEMVINFSNRSVNIKEVKNSNVVGGDVQGNVSNG